MKGKYRSMRLKKYKEEKDSWPPIKTKSYVTLAIVHQKELQTRQETTATIYLRTKGDIHKIPHTIGTEKLTDITQIFDPVSGRVPNSILIEGHAGIGKTTFVKEMCIEWAEGKLLTSDKLLFLLLLRDPNVQKITNEHKLIEYFTNYSTDELHKELVKSHGAGVTLIIDGFDELKATLRQESFFRNLIEKRCLSKAKIVLTSRPSASACLHDVVDRRLEILGFEQSSRNQYVNEALQDSPYKLKKLQRHFQQYPNIDAICYIPLIMSIIVFLCMCQPDDLPPTATKMYASFILHTIFHYLKRVGKIPEDEAIHKLEQFSPVVYKALQQLEKTAFDGLVRDKIIFTVEELPVLCKNDPTCYGLLQSTECYSAEEVGTPTQSFNFLHLGIQEYFAAKHVTKLPEDEVYTLLKESFIVTDDDDDDNDDDPDPDSKSVRLSNMWILYCGITSGQSKTLRHYLTTYGKPYDAHMTTYSNLHYQQIDPTLSHRSTTSIMSQWFDSLQPSSINSSYHPVTAPIQPVYSRYPMTPSRGQHITSYPQPYHLPTVYHPYQQQQLVQYPYHHQSNVAHTRSHDPTSHQVTMYNPNMTYSHRSHDQMTTPLLLSSHMIPNASHRLPSMSLPDRSHDHTMTSSAERYFTTSTSKQVDSNIDPQVTLEKMTAPSPRGSTSDQRISNTRTISQDALKDPLKVLYLFQCFQEAQDNELCEVLSKSFDGGEINVSQNKLLPHQVVSLGFFLSRSHRKWKELNLSQCYIGDHGMSIIHQYLCGDKTNKQEITEINLGSNNLTGASSHLIADIISHLQPHTIWLGYNNITNVRNISAAVINTSSVKVLGMWNNELTAQEAVAISVVMICLRGLNIIDNKLGDHGAELLSEGITNSKTLRVLQISHNNIGPSGTTAIANALTINTSLQLLNIRNNNIGPSGATAIANALTINASLQQLYISDNNIGPSGTTAIANALTINTSLQRLSISDNKIGPSGTTAIANALTINTSLKQLSISDNNIGPSGATAIANALTINTSLQQLYIRNNKIGPSGTRAIACALTVNTSLQQLNIRNNNMGPSGTMAIANALTINTSLQQLYIRNNNIGPSGTRAIASVLRINTSNSLQQLNISNNNIGPSGTAAIANALTINTSLQQLNIRNNNIGPSGTKAIANALGNNASLQLLYMNYNKIGQDGVIAIAKAITNNKTLKTLSLGDDTMDKESAMIIMRSLHCNNTITKLRLFNGLHHDDGVKGEAIKINERRNECNMQELEV